MAPATFFPQLILLSCSSFVICDNNHIHWLEEPQNICPTNKARLVLPHHFLCCERKWTILQVLPCWQHLYWRGSCPCFRGSAPEPLTWRTVEWGSARSPRLKDRRTHRQKRCYGIIVLVQSDLWPPSLLRQSSLSDEKDRTEDVTERQQLWFKKKKKLGQDDLVVWHRPS